MRTACLAEGSVDLALVTQGFGGEGGVLVHHEPLVGATSVNHRAYEQDPLPLALFDCSCLFRRWALERLQRIGRASRIAYTSVSIAGIYAALDAGLAVSVLSYAAAQACSGSLIVGLLALCCGTLWTFERERTGSLIAPLLSHMIWTPVVILLRPVAYPAMLVPLVCATIVD